MAFQKEETNITFPCGKSAFLAEFENAIDPSLCQDLIYNLSLNFKELTYQGGTGAGVNLNIKKSYDSSLMRQDVYNPQKLRTFPVFQSIDFHITERLRACAHEYRQNYLTLLDAGELHVTGLQVQKYPKNDGYYMEHVDTCPWVIDSHGADVTRILAIIVYLNDVEDGGETVFPLQNYKVKAKAGKVAMFPTSWMFPHAGRVPYSTDKWMISSFVTSKVQYFQ